QAAPQAANQAPATQAPAVTPATALKPTASASARGNQAVRGRAPGIAGRSAGNAAANADGNVARNVAQNDAAGTSAGAEVNCGRPSLLQGGFQRVDVNSSGDGAAAASADLGLGASELADLSQSADASFLVNGSVSRGLDMPQQNDWFGGPGGRMGMEGMGM